MIQVGYLAYLFFYLSLCCEVHRMKLKEKLKQALFERVQIVLDYAYEVYCEDVKSPIEKESFMDRVRLKMKGGND